MSLPKPSGSPKAWISRHSAKATRPSATRPSSTPPKGWLRSVRSAPFEPSAWPEPRAASTAKAPITR